MFGPCILVDPDFFSDENNIALQEIFAKTGQTIEEELKNIEIDCQVNIDSQLFGHHLAVTFSKNSQVLILSIPGVEKYQKGQRDICVDLLVGFSDEKTQLLDQLVTQNPSLHSCVELLFPVIS